MLSEPCSASEAFEAQHVRPAPGRVLIVGSRVYGSREDRRIRHAEGVGVDMLPGPGVDVVMDMETPEVLRLGKFAHIECMSVLEHSRRPWLLAANLERLLHPGGTIYVTAPFVWRVHAYPSDYWRFTREGVAALLPGIAWDALCYTHADVTTKNHIPRLELAGAVYFARTEVCGFGRLAYLHQIANSKGPHACSQLESTPPRRGCRCAATAPRDSTTGSR